MGRGGRRSKLTRERTERFVEMIRRGATIPTAASALGINPQTIHAWLHIGRKEDAPPLYRKFATEVDAAMAEWEIAQVERITRASETTWQAAAWLLERRLPDSWGRRERLDVRQATVISRLDESVRERLLSDDEVIRAVEAVAGRLAATESCDDGEPANERELQTPETHTLSEHSDDSNTDEQDG